MTTLTTTTSEQLFNASRAVVPGGVHSPVRAFKSVGTVPRFIEHAAGVQLRDVDSNTYVDYCMAWGAAILGHADEDVKQAANDALQRGWVYGLADPYSLQLADLICKELPWIEKIRFTCSGTEAVMSAVRVARAATKRTKILKFDGCYHGHFDAMLVRAGSGLAEMSEPDSAGINSNVAADTLVAKLDDLEGVEALFQQFPGQIAAIVVEGIPANNGLLLQAENYLRDLTKIAHQHGALIIIDEVITGFRVAFGGVTQHWDLAPDLVTYGKVLGGGMPLAAFGGRRDLMDLIAPEGPVYQAGTLSGNPLAASVGLITLEKLRRTQPYQRLAQLTERLETALQTQSIAAPKLHRFGSLFWLDFAEEHPGTAVRRPDQIGTRQKAAFGEFFQHALRHGIHLAPSGYEVCFISTQHTEAHIDALAKMCVHHHDQGARTEQP